MQQRTLNWINAGESVRRDVSQLRFCLHSRFTHTATVLSHFWVSKSIRTHTLARQWLRNEWVSKEVQCTKERSDSICIKPFPISSVRMNTDIHSDRRLNAYIHALPPNRRRITENDRRIYDQEEEKDERERDYFGTKTSFVCFGLESNRNSRNWHRSSHSEHKMHELCPASAFEVDAIIGILWKNKHNIFFSSVNSSNLDARHEKPFMFALRKMGIKQKRKIIKIRDE